MPSHKGWVLLLSNGNNKGIGEDYLPDPVNTFSTSNAYLMIGSYGSSER